MKKFYPFIYHDFSKYLLPTNNSYIDFFGTNLTGVKKSTLQTYSKNININKKGYFGTRQVIEIGDNSGAGVKCSSSGAIKIDSSLMISSEVLIISSSQTLEFAIWSYWS